MIEDTSHSWLLLGAGGHVRVVTDVIWSRGEQVLGCLDTSAERVGQLIYGGSDDGIQVVGTERELLEFLHDGSHAKRFGGVTAFHVGIGSNVIREKVFARLRDRIRAPALVHGSAVVSPTAELGAGSLIMPRAVLNANAQVGEGVIVNTGAILEHDCTVGAFAHVSPGATLCGAVTVGARAWVGAGAVVIPGVTVQDDAVVGAGAVVLRDVLQGQTVVGNPARPIHETPSP